MVDIFFFLLFWIKIKLNKVWNCQYWGPETGSSASLWDALYRSISNDTLKISGTHFSYNEKLKEETKIIRL